MKHFLAFLFLFLTVKGISQANKVLIKLSPLPLIDEVGFPAIQGGAEFMLSGKISWYNEVGIKYRKSYYESSDTGFVSSKGFKLKTEARYYFRNKNAFSFYGWYFAANAFFIHETRNAGIEYYYQGDTSMVRTDNFGTRKNIFGINLLYGYQHSFSKRFSYDIYAGLGIRVRNVRTINKDYDKKRDDIWHATDVNVNDIRNTVDAENNNPVLPNLSLGFRFCYKL